jgi:hypothetical protein
MTLIASFHSHTLKTSQRLSDSMAQASCRYKTLHTTFTTPKHTSTPDDATSICHQLFQHCCALMWLILSLCIISLQPAARICRWLHKCLFWWIETILNLLLYCAQWIQTLPDSQKPWPFVPNFIANFITCTLLAPTRLIEAILDFPKATRGHHGTLQSKKVSYPFEAQLETVFTISLIRRAPTSSIQYEEKQLELNTQQITTAAALDEIPTMDEHASAGYTSNELLKSSSSPNYAHNIIARSDFEVTTRRRRTTRLPTYDLDKPQLNMPKKASRAFTPTFKETSSEATLDSISLDESTPSEAEHESFSPILLPMCAMPTYETASSEVDIKKGCRKSWLNYTNSQLARTQPFLARGAASASEGSEKPARRASARVRSSTIKSTESSGSCETCAGPGKAPSRSASLPGGYGAPTLASSARLVKK